MEVSIRKGFYEPESTSFLETKGGKTTFLVRIDQLPGRVEKDVYVKVFFEDEDAKAKKDARAEKSAKVEKEAQPQDHPPESESEEAPQNHRPVFTYRSQPGTPFVPGNSPPVDGYYRLKAAQAVATDPKDHALSWHFELEVTTGAQTRARALCVRVALGSVPPKGENKLGELAAAQTSVLLVPRRNAILAQTVFLATLVLYGVFLIPLFAALRADVAVVASLVEMTTTAPFAVVLGLFVARGNRFRLPLLGFAHYLSRALLGFFVVLAACVVPRAAFVELHNATSVSVSMGGTTVPARSSVLVPRCSDISVSNGSHELSSRPSWHTCLLATFTQGSCTQEIKCVDSTDPLWWSRPARDDGCAFAVDDDEGMPWDPAGYRDWIQCPSVSWLRLVGRLFLGCGSASTRTGSSLEVWGLPRRERPDVAALSDRLLSLCDSPARPSSPERHVIFKAPGEPGSALSGWAFRYTADFDALRFIRSVGGVRELRFALEKSGDAAPVPCVGEASSLRLTATELGAPAGELHIQCPPKTQDHTPATRELGVERLAVPLRVTRAEVLGLTRGAGPSEACGKDAMTRFGADANYMGDPLIAWPDSPEFEHLGVKLVVERLPEGRELEFELPRWARCMCIESGQRELAYCRSGGILDRLSSSIRELVTTVRFIWTSARPSSTKLHTVVFRPHALARAGFTSVRSCAELPEWSFKRSTTDPLSAWLGPLGSGAKPASGACVDVKSSDSGKWVRGVFRGHTIDAPPPDCPTVTPTCRIVVPPPHMNHCQPYCVGPSED